MSVHFVCLLQDYLGFREMKTTSFSISSFFSFCIFHQNKIFIILVFIFFSYLGDIVSDLYIFLFIHFPLFFSFFLRYLRFHFHLISFFLLIDINFNENKIKKKTIKKKKQEKKNSSIFKGVILSLSHCSLELTSFQRLIRTRDKK